ncbi:MAG: thiamine biosynthesis protein ThiF [Thalassobius sp.]|nr:thiamine biosynthesis protein ThiF [Thalassovita sp.]
MFNYKEFTKRNEGYIMPEVQEKIKNTRLLIAGCGIGSTIAEAAIRLGFQKITLVDADIIELHNLNRQDYSYSDVEKPKVLALQNRLLAINPEATIEVHNDWVSSENAEELVLNADIVLDTIDFLSLEGIISLHDQCKIQEKPVISAVSAGWGAAALYFPPDCESSFRALFGVPEHGEVSHLSYVNTFKSFIEQLSANLEPDIIEALSKAFTIMQDGKPCPASQVAPGAFSVGALAMSIVVRILSGKHVAAAPDLVLLNMNDICTNQVVRLQEHIY